jgi:pyridoxamine 5'-phosphate oxidase family protein
MAVFSPAEIAYLQSQMLGRIASVGRDGQPHVVPVAFRYNADLDTIDVGGHGFARRKKFRDVRRNPRVAFVVDDVPSTDPWTPRGIEVRGEAEISDTGGKEIMPDFDDEMFSHQGATHRQLGTRGGEMGGERSLGDLTRRGPERAPGQGKRGPVGAGRPIDPFGRTIRGRRRPGWRG